MKAWSKKWLDYMKLYPTMKSISIGRELRVQGETGHMKPLDKESAVNLNT